MAEPDLSRGARGRVGLGAGRLCPGHLASRLTPLARDDARRRQDAMLYSVAAAGLSRQQIAEVEVAARFDLRRLLPAAARLMARWRRMS